MFQLNEWITKKNKICRSIMKKNAISFFFKLIFIATYNDSLLQPSRLFIGKLYI